MLETPISLPASAQRVQDALIAAGAAGRVATFPDSTRTAAEAAAAIGCTVGQIAKSLIFRADPGDRPVLVIASGDNRVHEKRLATRLAEDLAGAALARADADFVRAATGFAIGGVAPVGHRPSAGMAPALLVLDEDLFGYNRIWAAAGTPNAVFPTGAEELARITGARVVPVT